MKWFLAILRPLVAFETSVWWGGRKERVCCGLRRVGVEKVVRLLFMMLQKAIHVAEWDADAAISTASNGGG